MLRWHIQQGRQVIPKSVTPSRIAENFDVFGFDLAVEQLAAIDGLDTGIRGGPEPEDITRQRFGRDIPESLYTMNRRTLMTEFPGPGRGCPARHTTRLLQRSGGAAPRLADACGTAIRPRLEGVARVLLSTRRELRLHGGRINLDVGNTEVLAGMISSAVAVDVYRIQAAEPYPNSYQETVERNKREQDTEARPAIAGALPTVELFDTVLFGSPIWNVRPPMIMRTFIDRVDLRGKPIYLFVTWTP